MNGIFTEIAVVVAAAALLSWLALIARQPVIVAYVAAGAILGPNALRVVHGVEFIDEVSHIGVSLLLFLAGVVLHPRRLLSLLRETLVVTLVSSGLFALAAGLFCLAWGFTPMESLIGGLAMMFSSTILVVKLMPTTTLHQKHMGSLSIAVLIAQDFAAVAILLLVTGGSRPGAPSTVLIPLLGAAFIAAVILLERYVVRRMMVMVERFQEILLLVALGFCFASAMAAEAIGLSHEVGAFVAGIALARSPLSFFVSDGLRFFRDFFLVLFFFALGARIDFVAARAVALPALLLAVLVIVVKPLVFAALFRASGEERGFSRQIGLRLGQASEFTLIVEIFAESADLVSAAASQMVQITALITMVVSSYLTVNLFPTPLSTNRQLKQD